MAAVLSADALVEVICRSRLIGADDVARLLDELKEAGVDVEDPQALADALVEGGWLTKWQAEYLLQGKHKGFFIGPYRFLTVLGKGGMGAVYLAEHEMMKRRCAIKVLPAKSLKGESSVLERFYLEAQAVAALDHPNIVRAYDVNKEHQGKSEIHYLVMEYVEGKDLQTLVRERGGGLPCSDVAEYIRQAALGLAHAHENGLIHRDIKPANLLVDTKGTVKILDLGLARFFDDSANASLTTAYNESILGTADYLSPEQALNSHEVDTRTDIYSLGCTAYFALTGRPPFPDGSVAQRLIAHQVKKPDPISELRPDVPADLVAIVEKMMAKSPDDRYQSADELAEVLRSWLVNYGDPEWTRQHPDLASQPASAAALAGAETTRIGVAEDTELGLAPLDDDRPNRAETEPPDEDQAVAASESGLLPVDDASALLQPIDGGTASDAAPSIQPDLSEPLDEPLDELLSQPLEELPSSDSGVSLGAAVPLGPGQSGSHSGLNLSQSGPHAALPQSTGEGKQLLWLLLIGLGISVPVAAAILIVSLYIAAPPAKQFESVPGSSEPIAQGEPSQPDGSETPKETADKTSGTRADPTEGTETAVGQQRPVDQEDEREIAGGQPTESKEGEGSGELLAERGRDERPAQEATTPTRKGPPEGAADEGQEAPSGEPDGHPRGGQGSSPPVPPNREPSQEENDEGDQSKERTFTDDEKTEMLARVKNVAVMVTGTSKHKQLDRIYLMIARMGVETLSHGGVKARIGVRDPSESVLMLALQFEPQGPYLAVALHGELRVRVGEKQWVPVWGHTEALGSVSARSLGSDAVYNVLRDRVDPFFEALARDHHAAVERYGRPGR